MDAESKKNEEEQPIAQSEPGKAQYAVADQRSKANGECTVQSH
jgi:hypothetical protein